MSDPHHHFECEAFEGGPQAGQFAIAAALMHVSTAIERLGNNNADTGMGAIEGLAKEVGKIALHVDVDEAPDANAAEISNGLAQVAEQIGNLASAVVYMSENLPEQKAA